MDIKFEMVINMIMLVSAGLGLGLGLKFLKWITNGSGWMGTTWIFENRMVRLTAWLILGSLFVKPFMDLSSLLIEFAKIPYLLTQSISERVLPVGWEIAHYSLYVGIRALLLSAVYGYAIWMVPEILKLGSIGKRGNIKAGSFEGICIALTCGGLLHAFVAPIAFSIQQLPIPALLGYEDTLSGYFIGWMMVLIILPVILYGLGKVISKSLEPKVILGTNAS